MVHVNESVCIAVHKDPGSSSHSSSAGWKLHERLSRSEGVSVSLHLPSLLSSLPMWGKEKWICKE